MKISQYVYEKYTTFKRPFYSVVDTGVVGQTTTTSSTPTGYAKYIFDESTGTIAVNKESGGGYYVPINSNSKKIYRYQRGTYAG
ncbi:hypothetical protein [Lysinibacillus sp. NPDC093692]|uniref:hypothetical protein n=1 Tax=Lysinibacillus sp. NPDC093692 TaxID=3390578 RepID=UPI003D011C0B